VEAAGPLEGLQALDELLELGALALLLDTPEQGPIQLAKNGTGPVAESSCAHVLDHLAELEAYLGEVSARTSTPFTSDLTGPLRIAPPLLGTARIMGIAMANTVYSERLTTFSSDLFSCTTHHDWLPPPSP
jgi:hypothetical protein